MDALFEIDDRDVLEGWLGGLDVVGDLARAGRCVLMTTHQPAHALTHANRAVLMRNGALVADGPPENVVTSERLSDLYRVRVHVAQVQLPGEHGRTVGTCIPIPPTPPG
jgi:iron complex transport system ATP-binding protein